MSNGGGLPKTERLRRRRDFLRVQGSGVKVHSAHLLGMALPSGGARRVGLTVSSKVGGAVVRNRIRRRLRAVYQSRRLALPEGVDVVLIAKVSARAASYVELERSFEQVARGLSRRFPCPS